MLRSAPSTSTSALQPRRHRLQSQLQFQVPFGQKGGYQHIGSQEFFEQDSFSPEDSHYSPETFESMDSLPVPKFEPFFFSDRESEPILCAKSSLHRSPGSRHRWSPVVHTISEAGEASPESYGQYTEVEPLKLVDDSSENTQAPSGDYGDYGLSNEPRNEIGPNDALRPALQPNVPPIDLSNGAPVEPEPPGVTLEVLLSELQRLTNHDFGARGKLASYPTELEALFQRMNDYHVCLKNARKKLTNVAFSSTSAVESGSPKPGATNELSFSPSMAHEKVSTPRRRATMCDHRTRAKVWSPSPLTPPLSRFAGKNNSAGNLVGGESLEAGDSESIPKETRVPSELSEETKKKIGQLEEKVQDLEQQLIQSRRAHHSLLQDHILNAAAHLASQTSNTNNGGVIQSVLKTEPAIQSILAQVPDPLSPKVAQAVEAEALTPVEEQRADKQQTKQQRKRYLSLLIGSRKEINGLDSASPMTPSHDAANQLTAPLSDTRAQITLSVTRLLRAETELGLLKLVMAQNQRDITGLEDEIFQKQKELFQRRQVFERALDANWVMFETKVQDGQIQIRELDGRVTKAEQEKEETKEAHAKAEKEIEALKQLLEGKTRDLEQANQEWECKVQELERVIVDLRGQMDVQASTSTAFSDQGDDRSTASISRTDFLDDTEDQWVTHLEKGHKKTTAALKANLVKSQKTIRRLQKEVSTLAMKLVQIHTLNEELEEQAKSSQQKLQEVREQMMLPESEIEFKSQDEWNAVPSERKVIGGSIPNFSVDLGRKVAELEAQVDDLKSTLRRKEAEVTQAQDALEKALVRHTEAEDRYEESVVRQRKEHEEAMRVFAEEKKDQAQRERACQNTSVMLFQNMVTRLQNELTETQEKLHDTTACWTQTKEQLQKSEMANRRRKKELEETTRNLKEVEDTLEKVGVAVELLEREKEISMELVRSLEARDRDVRDMEYRLQLLEDEQKP